jgi:ATP-binding cassette subfamily F protein uup
LLSYNGTILVVSHDRSFLNNVVTSTMVFEGIGRLTEYVGGYDDWVQQRDPAGTDTSQLGAVKANPKRRERPPREKDRLSYREARELEALPGIIDALEAEKEALVARLSDPAFYVTGDSSAAKVSADRLEALEAELDAAYARGENLEAFAPGQTG